MFPILNLSKMSKIRGRRQGWEFNQSFKKGLFLIFDDASNTVQVFVVSRAFLITALWGRYCTKPDFPTVSIFSIMFSFPYVSIISP